MRTGGSATIVAKLLSTFASHGGAAIIPFDPVVALRALFEFGSFHKVDKLLVMLVKCVADTILSASHAVMVGTSAS